ncbi:hypothetical protein VTK56DRAFT_3479 [Thermocarpiscus australiensis]
MAANMNMPQMVPNGQMMLPVQQQNQQPQPYPSKQLNQFVYNSLMQSMSMVPVGSWQSTMNIGERFSRAINLTSNMLLAVPNSDWQKLCSTGLEFERRVFLQSPDKQAYDNAMLQKTAEMVQRRKMNAPELQNQLSTDAARQAQLQAQQRQHQQQQMFFSQMAARGLGHPPQPGFQPLQNPMQAPAMSQPPQQLGMGMTPPPGMLQNRPEQRQLPMQMGLPRQPSGFPVDVSQLSQQDRARINDLALKLMASASEQQKQQARQLVQQKLTPAQIAEFTATGRDPVFLHYHNQAMWMYTNQAAAMQRSMLQAGVLPPSPHQGQQMNPALMGAMPQQPVMPDGQMFAPNLETIRSEQARGLLAQKAGQMVVPASTTPARNATAGPVTGLPPQVTAGNQQGPNQAPRPPQVQQPFGMPPVTMDPATAQAQSQPGPRAPARTMQNQPGAVATPTTASQSSQGPAMNAVNAAARQPPLSLGQGNGQLMNQGTPSMGATLNPQFNHQSNTRPPPLQGTTNNPAVEGMMPNLTPEARASIGALPDDGLRQLMAKWQEKQRSSASAGFQGPKQGQAPGMPGQVQPGPISSPNQAAMANANQKGNGVMPPAPQQTPVQQHSPVDRARFLAFVNSPQGQASMNSMDIPPAILSQLRGSLPPDTRKWAQLRQFCSNNPSAIPITTQNQLHVLQMQQFRSLWEKKRLAASFPQGPQPPNAPTQQQQANHSLALPPGVQYPPNISQVTPQELESFRKSYPRFQTMPDETLLEIARKVKRDSFARKAWEFFNQSLQAQGNNNAGPGPGPGPHKMTTQVPQTPTTQPGSSAPQPSARAGVQQQNAPTKPVGAPAADAAAPPVSTNLKTARPPPQQTRPTPPNPSPASAPKNLKRPNPDDVDGVPDQTSNAMQRGPSQSDARPATGAPKPGPEQLANLTPEQLAKLPPEQRAALARSRLRPSADSEELTRLKQIASDEQRLAMQDSQQELVIPMSPAELQETRLKITKAVEKINQVRGSVMPNWYRVTRDDSRARMFFRTRFKVVRQYVDGERMTQLRDSLTISKGELDQFISMVDSMLRDLAVAWKAMQDGSAAAAQRGGQIPPQAATLGAADLDKQTQAALKQAQNRTVSKPGQPPAAPTTTQPPFQFGIHATPAPHPEYYGEPRLNPANLAIPPARKKARTGQVQTSPALAQQQSPASSSSQTKAPSPVANKKTEPTKAPPKLTCPEPGCEANSTGFQTEEALNAHRQEEHVKPFENPFEFVKQQMADALGLDTQGNPKPSPKPSGPEGAAPAAPPMSASLSRQSQTAKGKTELAATPMSREASMRRQGSAQGGKGGENAGTTGKNAATRSDATPRLGDSKVPTGKQDGGDLKTAMLEDAWDNPTVDPQDLFAKLGSTLDLHTGNIISDLGIYRSLTPNGTPESSKDSGASEPTSDIAESAALNIDLTWQPLDNDLLLDMDNIRMEGLETLDTDMTGAEPFPFSLDDMENDFSKPLRLDTSLYSMDAT